MKILHEDQNKLVFKVYPDKLYTFALIFLIGITTVYLLTHQNLKLYEMATGIVLLSLFSVHAAVSFFFPIRVTIDKSEDTLKYFDFSLFPKFLIRNQQDVSDPPLYHYNSTHKIAISHLTQIEVKKVFGGALNPTFFTWFYNNNGTDNISIQFVTDNTEPVTIAPGIFSYRRHREACVKIASYLTIPFKDSL